MSRKTFAGHWSATARAWHWTTLIDSWQLYQLLACGMTIEQAKEKLTR